MQSFASIDSMFLQKGAFTLFFKRVEYKYENGSIVLYDHPM